MFKHDNLILKCFLLNVNLCKKFQMSQKFAKFVWLQSAKGSSGLNLLQLN